MQIIEYFHRRDLYSLGSWSLQLLNLRLRLCKLTHMHLVHIHRQYPGLSGPMCRYYTHRLAPCRHLYVCLQL